MHYDQEWPNWFASGYTCLWREQCHWHTRSAGLKTSCIQLVLGGYATTTTTATTSGGDAAAETVWQRRRHGGGGVAEAAWRRRRSGVCGKGGVAAEAALRGCVADVAADAAEATWQRKRRGGKCGSVLSKKKTHLFQEKNMFIQSCTNKYIEYYSRAHKV